MGARSPKLICTECNPSYKKWWSSELYKWSGDYMVSVYWNPYIFNVERASADAPRGSMKYQLTCLNIRLFKCGYRIFIFIFIMFKYIYLHNLHIRRGIQTYPEHLQIELGWNGDSVYVDLLDSCTPWLSLFSFGLRRTIPPLRQSSAHASGSFPSWSGSRSNAHRTQ